jgi:hypothetical protein
MATAAVAMAPRLLHRQPLQRLVVAAGVAAGRARGAKQVQARLSSSALANAAMCR